MKKKTQGHKDTRAQGLKTVLLAILSGILLSLSFPGVEAAWLAWLAFVPLLSCLEKKSKPRAFWFAYLSGVVFWGLTVYWLVHVTLLGTVLLVLYLALFFGLFGVIVSWYESWIGRQTAPLGFLLFVPSAWVILEYGRSHLLTGFPWALAGYSQYQMLPVIQIASVTGAWGVSFLVVLVNACVYALVRRDAAKVKVAVVCIAAMAAALGYGYYVLSRPAPSDSRPALKVSVIQANIPQELKWNPAARELITEKYLVLSRQGLLQGPHLVIWPEAAVPVIMEEGSQIRRLLQDFVKENKSGLLAGAVTQQQGVYYNSAVLFLPDKETVQRYDKLHLVPFGEYIPLKRLLPFLETVVPIGDMAAGKKPTVLEAYLTQGSFHALRSRFGTLICFEDVFPEISRGFILAGAHFLVNITNDAWYKKTAAARQHFQASVFRAVENRAVLVRCANTGVSGFIGPDGEIISLVRDAKGQEIFVTGILTQEIQPSRASLTLYTRFGDWFIIACLCLAVCIILRERRNVAAKP